MLWTKQIPNLYRYSPIGIADPEPSEPKAQTWLQKIHETILRKCTEDSTQETFPNEPIICSDKTLLDDSKGSFQKLDNVITNHGLPKENPFLS